MATEFKLPELGENIHEGDVVSVLVNPGDKIEVDQPVMEIETNKAVFEVPSSVAGVIKEVHVKAGEKAQVGQTVLTLEDVTATNPDVKLEAERVKAEPGPTVEQEVYSREGVEPYAEDQRTKVPLPQEQQYRTPQPASTVTPEERGRVAQEQQAGGQQQAAAQQQQPAPIQQLSGPQYAQTLEAVSAEPEILHTLAPAAPSTRRVAREMGVDINRVPGSGPGGRISVEDVQRFAAQTQTRQAAPAPAAPSAPPPAPAATRVPEQMPDFSKFGPVDRKPMSNVRRITAEHLSFAWTTIPHVTQYDKADITELEELRKRYAKRAEAAGGKLTVTAILIKAIVGALRAFPQFNASVDMQTNEIIYKQYYNIGVAVDTERGLLVPVIKDADKKGIVEIAVELGQMAERARNRKTTPDEMSGATFSITNLGGIGGTYFAPIVNWPEVAILGVSRSRTEPVWQDGQFVPRTMLPLSLSYDHRIIDGADGIRFLRWLVEALEQPFLIALG